LAPGRPAPAAPPTTVAVFRGQLRSSVAQPEAASASLLSFVVVLVVGSVGMTAEVLPEVGTVVMTMTGIGIVVRVGMMTVVGTVVRVGMMTVVGVLRVGSSGVMTGRV
ncbi:hypothetical protein, partial [Streptomyces sp. JV184]|uniref:hypothetical protein n=1 Tax=Streptomyces sp. JV184 TaxID=858637 RepID=UPI002E7DA34F|nr:hypothetical protein [Streptomyces sp. JV184]